MSQVHTASLTKNASSFTRRWSWSSLTLRGAFCALCVAPMFLMYRFCFTQGGNSFSDDYGFYILFLSKFWNGDATLKDFLVTSMHGPHFVAIPLALRMVSLRAGYWSPDLESAATFVIAALRTVFLWLIFAPRIRNVTGKFAVALISCAAIFSSAQLSMFVYGDTGITMGLDNLGLLLGLWGLLKFQKRSTGVLIACAGGILSTASWGVGVGWLIFLIGMFCSGFRSMKHYVVLVCAAVISHIPMMIRTIESHGSADGLISLFNPLFIVGALGRPLTTYVDRIEIDYAPALVVGSVGLLMALVLIVITARRIRNAAKEYAAVLLPSALLMTYSLLCLYEVSVFRGGIGSWYTALSENFWIALFILALALFDGGKDSKSSNRIKWPQSLGAFSMLVLTILYLFSNRSYEDKTPFLKSRSLSAESCIRHWENSPTYCELLVFMWQPTYEFESFSKFFERTQTSAFAAHQTWSVQGDYPLTNVTASEPSAASRVRWASDNGRGHLTDASWKSSERLDMMVGPQGALNWSLDLPTELKRARLRTDVRGDGTHVSLTVDGHVATLPIAAPGRDHWSTVDVSLDQFAGKTVVISFSNSAESADAGPAEFRYPRVDIQQTPRLQRALEVYRGTSTWVPTNTDRSTDFPVSTTNDLVIDPSEWLVWKDMYQHVFTTKDPGACIGDYSAMKFSVAIPNTISKRMFRIVFHVVHPDGSHEDAQADMALLEDSRLHGYSYDLRLLGVDYASRLSSIRVFSPFGQGAENEKDVRFNVQNMRLVRKSDENSLCGTPLSK